MLVECMNEECGWSGDVVETISLRGKPDTIICPKCYDKVHLPDSEPDTKAEALRLRDAFQPGASDGGRS